MKKLRRIRVELQTRDTVRQGVGKLRASLLQTYDVIGKYNQAAKTSETRRGKYHETRPRSSRWTSFRDASNCRRVCRCSSSAAFLCKNGRGRVALAHDEKQLMLTANKMVVAWRRTHRRDLGGVWTYPSRPYVHSTGS